MTSTDRLQQHIHAGYWLNGRWTSWPHTFASRRGFERWATKRAQRGAAVQWRFCGAEDAAPAVCVTAWARGQRRTNRTESAA